MGFILFGSASKLSGTGSQSFTRLDFAALDENANGIGGALVAGDFNGDGRDDLAIGLPEATVNGVGSAGLVVIAYGTNAGLTNAGAQVWHQDTSGILDVAENIDLFGEALAAGDFDNDGRDDLAIAAPREDFTFGEDAGSVAVLYGTITGLDDEGNQRWTQVSSGLLGDGEADDRFGGLPPS